MNKTQKQSLIGISFLMLAQTMVSINIVSCKILLTSMSFTFLLFVRFTLASIVLLPLHWFNKPQQSILADFKQLTRRDWQYLFFQAISAGILFNCLMLTGLKYTDANVAGIITSALPAIITAMSYLFLKETLSFKKYLCLFFASIGLFAIACDKLGTISAQHSFFGDTIVFLSLIPEAAYYLLCKSHAIPLPLFLLSSVFNAINAIFLIIWMLVAQPGIPEISLFSGSLLFMLGITSALFFVLFFMGCSRVDSVMASLSTGIMPVATVILAWFILNEALTTGQLVGMGLVIFSIIIYATR